MVDTEFSILDSLFYPWMKDINSPWWYRPDKAYTEWATPYPMATLEVQRPRMRYKEYPSAMDSRKDSEYTSYSYKYIGVKPTSYSAFQPNGGGVSNLLRSISLTADMCIVDLTGDVAGSGKGTTNLGNRTGFIFGESPNSGSGSQPDQEEDTKQDEPNHEEELKEQKDRLDEFAEMFEDMLAEVYQQGEGDMPGEDEDEWGDYNEDEYADPYGDDEYQDSEMDMDEDDSWNDIEVDDGFNTGWGDESEPWEGDGSSETGDPNGDLSDYTMEQESQIESEYGEPGVTGEVQDGMMDVGSEQAEATASEQGWQDDGSNGSGVEESMLDKAIGGAVDLAKSGVELIADGATGLVDLATSATKSAVGFAGSLASAAMDAFTPSSPQAQAQQASQTPATQETSAQTQSSEGQKQEKGLLATVGDALGNVLGSAQTAFGTVANALSGSNQNSTLVGGVFNKCLSAAFPSCGNIVGQAGNLIGGALSKVTGGVVGPSQVTGALRQMTYAKSNVGSTSTMATALNAAAAGIYSSTGIVGDVARSVLNAGGGHAQGDATGDFGQLVNRMVTSNSAKPTPLESFVGMVTKQNAKGSTSQA